MAGKNQGTFSMIFLDLQFLYRKQDLHCYQKISSKKVFHIIVRWVDKMPILTAIFKGHKTENKTWSPIDNHSIQIFYFSLRDEIMEGGNKCCPKVVYKNPEDLNQKIKLSLPWRPSSALLPTPCSGQSSWGTAYPVQRWAWAEGPALLSETLSG